MWKATNLLGEPLSRMTRQALRVGHQSDIDYFPECASGRVHQETRINTGVDLAAPQGFEPRYADPESAVLPLNEGAVITLCGCAYNSAHLIVWRCYSSVNQTLRQRPLAMFACSLWSSRRKHSPEISTCALAATSGQSRKPQSQQRPAKLRT